MGIFTVATAFVYDAYTQDNRAGGRKKKKSEVHLPFVAGEANKNNLTSLCTFTGVLGLTFIK